MLKKKEERGLERILKFIEIALKRAAKKKTGNGKRIPTKIL